MGSKNVYAFLVSKKSLQDQLENFPEGGHDDIVDALSGAFLMLTDSAYDLASLTML